MTNSRFAPLAALAALAATLSACPGRINDIDPFIGPTGEGGVTSCNIAASQVEQQLIRPRCATAGCHDRGDRAGGLDLQSPNVAVRLVGVASSCMGRPLVDPMNRGSSYFLEKLGASPACGRQMPMGATAFSASEVACARNWVMSLDPNAGPPDVVVPDATPPRDVVMSDIAVPDTGAPDVTVMPADGGMDVTAPPRDSEVPDTSTPPRDSTVVDSAAPDSSAPMDASVPMDAGADPG